MGCSASTHGGSVAPVQTIPPVVDVKMKGGAPDEEGGTVAKHPGADVVGTWAEKNSDNISTMGTYLASATGVAPEAMEIAKEMLAKFGDLGDLVDSPGIKMLKDSFLLVDDVVKMVAHCVVPPPGGQIIAAAITITSMVLKGAMNVRACRELACRCNRMVQIAFPNKEVLSKGNVPPNLKKTLKDFEDVCLQIQTFVEDVVKQGWWKKLLTVTDTAKEIERLDSIMESVLKALHLCYSVETFNDVQDIKNRMTQVMQEMQRDEEKVQGVIERYGGLAAICDDPEALQELANVTSGNDAVMLQLQTKMGSQVKETHSVVLEIKAYMKANTVDQVEGPHCLIGNEHLKTLWREKFRTSESISWDKFFAVFPAQTPSLDPADIQILDKELKEPEDRAKLRLACDRDNNESLNVLELNKAFPQAEPLIDRVRELKASPSRIKGSHFGMKLPPRRLFGRTKEVEKLVSILGPESTERVALLQGGPGVGKQTVAAEALQRLYNDDKALCGVWTCTMAGVTSYKDMLLRIIGGLSIISKASEAEAGEEATLRNRLAEFAADGAALFLVVDACEDVVNFKAAANKEPGDTKTLLDRFDSALLQMVQAVPNMKILLTSRENFTCKQVESALNTSVHKMDLQSLTLEEGMQMVQTNCPTINQRDAREIADIFNCNPFILDIICDALKEGRMSLEDVKDRSNLNELGEGHRTIETGLSRVEASVMRSLNTFIPEQKTTLLKMGLVLPGAFDEKAMRKILPFLSLSQARLWLGRFEACRLLELTGTKNYRVTPFLRETAYKIYSDTDRAAANGISGKHMEPVWKSFFVYCQDLVKKDLNRCNNAPMTGFELLVRNRPWVQQALCLVIDNPDVARPSIKQLVDMILHLPYLGNVHDGNLVGEACRELFNMVADDEDMGDQDKAVAQGVCKAVQSHFMAAKVLSQQEEIIPVVDEVRELLGNSSNAEAQVVHAMALRRKGVVLRDMHKYEESAEALQEAKYLVENTGMPTALANLELILDLAELAGTLDYAGDIIQGVPIAEQALSCARRFYGEDASHPVTALCLTAYGYFMRNKGLNAAKKIKEAEEAVAAAHTAGNSEEECIKREEVAILHRNQQDSFQKALEVHKEAMRMREEKLGSNHLEVALSQQQAGLCMLALQQYEEAQSYMESSLNIRLNALGREHFLVFNTYQAMSDLYIAWDEKDKALRSLTTLVSIGRRVWASETKVHKKMKAAATSLASMQRKLGYTDAAKTIESEFRLSS